MADSSLSIRSRTTATDVPESALGIRFIEQYRGSVPFAKGHDHDRLEAHAFRQVVEAVGARGQFSRRDGWRLEGHGNYGQGRSFDGSYWALMQWARREGLLASWLGARWSSGEDQIRFAVLTRARPPDYAVPEDWARLDEQTQGAWWERFRNEVWERDQMKNFVDLRNLVAHPMAATLVMPLDSARAVLAVADFLTRLWPENAT